MKSAAMLDAEVPVWTLMAGAAATIDGGRALEAMYASSLLERGKLLMEPKGVVGVRLGSTGSGPWVAAPM